MIFSIIVTTFLMLSSAYSNYPPFTPFTPHSVPQVYDNASDFSRKMEEMERETREKELERRIQKLEEQSVNRRWIGSRTSDDDY